MDGAVSTGGVCAKQSVPRQGDTSFTVHARFCRMNGSFGRIALRGVDAPQGPFRVANSRRSRRNTDDPCALDQHFLKDCCGSSPAISLGSTCFPCERSLYPSSVSAPHPTTGIGSAQAWYRTHAKPWPGSTFRFAFGNTDHTRFEIGWAGPVLQSATGKPVTSL